MICPHPPVFWSLWGVSSPLDLFGNVFIALLSSCSVFVWGLKEIEKLSCHCYCLLRIPQLFLSLTFYSLCLTSYMFRHLLLCSAHFSWRFIPGNPLRTGKKLHSSREHFHFPLLDTWGDCVKPVHGLEAFRPVGGSVWAVTVIIAFLEGFFFPCCAKS